eukprot:jgi/Tetstr1/447477/TSEL_003734.t1
MAALSCSRQLLALEGGYGAETDLSRVQHRRGRDYSAARLGMRRDWPPGRIAGWLEEDNACCRWSRRGAVGGPTAEAVVAAYGELLLGDLIALWAGARRSATCRTDVPDQGRMGAAQVVVESADVAAVWKTAGVDTQRADFSPRADRAGPPVLFMAQRMWGNQAHVCSDLEKSAAGLVLVAKTEAGWKALEAAKGRIHATFDAVVLDGNDPAQMRLGAVVCPGCTSAWEAASQLQQRQGLYTVGRDGTVEIQGAKGAHIALTALEGLPRELGLGAHVAADAPKKFHKLLRRTRLNAQRRASLETLSAVGIREVKFCGHTFSTTSEQLMPRKSSEAVVQAAISYIDEQPSRTERHTVLDLGTGSGCMLLSILLGCPEVAGVGVDLSAEALELAERNAQPLSDFAPYSVIVCNPPYLAGDRSEGRITGESDAALYAGKTGYEAYAAVTKSVAACEPRLLCPDGVLLLQAPGGERGHAKVAAIARQAGWEPMRVVDDYRGVGRVVVCILRPSGDP